ncbi:MAG: hypothetical protein LBM98_07835 [Oscillospiraceae bacterium]|nr:hypothetical protein [Oscillospiraceae bacterium]
MRSNPVVKAKETYLRLAALDCFAPQTFCVSRAFRRFAMTNIFALPFNFPYERASYDCPFVYSVTIPGVNMVFCVLPSSAPTSSAITRTTVTARVVIFFLFI